MKGSVAIARWSPRGMFLSAATVALHGRDTLSRTSCLLSAVGAFRAELLGEFLESAELWIVAGHDLFDASVTTDAQLFQLAVLQQVDAAAKHELGESNTAQLAGEQDRKGFDALQFGEHEFMEAVVYFAHLQVRLQTALQMKMVDPLEFGNLEERR